MLITITKLEPFKDDKRGLAFNFELRDSNYIVTLYRKKGSISGQHYHKGAFKSKSPEIFYLAKGRVKLIVKDMKLGIQEEYIVEEHSKIEIPQTVYHEVHALTDIILIEFNCEKDDFKTDTVKILSNK
jgi:oxalate decarboxylase/phosphoglucose isomerase-like protein (cupin superfamily)